MLALCEDTKIVKLLLSDCNIPFITIPKLSFIFLNINPAHLKLNTSKKDESF